MIDVVFLRTDRWAEWLRGRSSRVKHALLMTWDGIWVALLAGMVPWAVRGGVPLGEFLGLMGVGVGAVWGVFHWFGLYRQVVRFISEEALLAVTKGTSTAALVWGGMIPWLVPGWSMREWLATAVVLWLALLVTTGGSRLLLRAWLWQPVRRRFKGRQALVYGANDAGWQLVSALRQSRELLAAAFVDDDPAVIGKEFGGLRVYGADEIGLLVRRYEVQEAIVALPNASEFKRRQVVELLCQHNLRVRVMPPAVDFAAGFYLPRIVREVDVGDLLGRNRVAPDPRLLREAVAGESVMVTGAGGSIGMELCRQIALLAPRRIVLVELNEFALYQVQQLLLEMGFVEHVPALGSIEDRLWLETLIEQFEVRVVFHAAAYKHVPLVERNVLQGVRNNVLGTWRLLEACRSGEVERFVLISSDKAVNPSNVMGATKRWQELLTRAVAQLERPAGHVYTMVRFGNVLGSSGSVVPLFQRQIRRGGPVTVTHPEVTRYFMSVHEAVELVLQAASMAKGGEVFLLDMGEPVPILELARKLIRLAGLSERNENNPDGDVEIVFTGLRPGEKLHEELVIGSNVQPTSHPKIRQAMEPYLEWSALAPWLQELEEALAWGDGERVRRALFTVAKGEQIADEAEGRGGAYPSRERRGGRGEGVEGYR
ncbi:MAG: polysaccharide biosynthesis protein [Hydrogenophilus sp.]|nr:polysaccharide biosynthesis protein [Hydrogenophilus sp.]